MPSRLNRVIIAPQGGTPKGPGSSSERPVPARSVWSGFPNGLRVLVKRVPNLPLVNIQAHVLGGSSTDDEQVRRPRGNDGRPVGQGYDSRRLTQPKSPPISTRSAASELQRGPLHLHRQRDCLKEDFPKAAALFADSLLYPAFPEDQFMRSKLAFVADIENRSADAAAEAEELFLDFAARRISPYHVNPERQGRTPSIG